MTDNTPNVTNALLAQRLVALPAHEFGGRRPAQSQPTEPRTGSEPAPTPLPGGRWEVEDRWWPRAPWEAEHRWPASDAFDPAIPNGEAERHLEELRRRGQELLRKRGLELLRDQMREYDADQRAKEERERELRLELGINQIA